jgi:hypothetical protein
MGLKPGARMFLFEMADSVLPEFRQTWKTPEAEPPE